MDELILLTGTLAIFTAHVEIPIFSSFRISGVIIFAITGVSAITVADLFAPVRKDISSIYSPFSSSVKEICFSLFYHYDFE